MKDFFSLAGVKKNEKTELYFPQQVTMPDEILLDPEQEDYGYSHEQDKEPLYEELNGYQERRNYYCKIQKELLKEEKM